MSISKLLVLTNYCDIDMMLIYCSTLNDKTCK